MFCKIQTGGGGMPDFKKLNSGSGVHGEQGGFVRRAWKAKHTLRFRTERAEYTEVLYGVLIPHKYLLTLTSFGCRSTFRELRSP